MKINKVLIMAGSDSGGGAGIQADLKTVAALGGYAMTVITALTAQNTRGVEGVMDVPVTFIEKQFQAVVSDMEVDAVKTGMLFSSPIIRCAARLIEESGIDKVVVDPVMTAKGGGTLLKEEARRDLLDKLLPLALVVTPNIPEAELITGVKIAGLRDMKKAARLIHGLGAAHVVIKGGHLAGDAVDILYDGRHFREFRSPRLETIHTHGTGCTFAAAVATLLAQGRKVNEAVQGAKDYVTEIVSFGLPIGSGPGPMHHFMPLIRQAERYQCLEELKRAVGRLKSARLGYIIPEVQSNFGYALSSAVSSSDIAAYPGRLVSVGENIEHLHEPVFGASRHISSVILAVMRFDPSCRAAMNIRFNEEILHVFRLLGLRVSSFDRADEPADVKMKEGSSLEWGTTKAIMEAGVVPDVVYDRGGVGKEPVVRVLGKHPDEVADKVLKIAKALVGKGPRNGSLGRKEKLCY